MLARAPGRIWSCECQRRLVGRWLLLHRLMRRFAFVGRITGFQVPKRSPRADRARAAIDFRERSTPAARRRRSTGPRRDPGRGGRLPGRPDGQPAAPSVLCREAKAEGRRGEIATVATRRTSPPVVRTPRRCFDAARTGQRPSGQARATSPRARGVGQPDRRAAPSFKM